MINKQLVIKTRDGKIILEVEGKDDFMVIEPALAVQMGQSMIDAAMSLGVDVRVVVPAKEITPAHRVRMIVRCQHVIRSMHEAKAKLPRMATEVVDTLLEMLP